MLNQRGDVLVTGKFPFFSSKWRVTDRSDREIGLLKQKFSFASKKFEYTAHGRGTFQIFSGAFSREYDITTIDEEVIATFKKISGFFSSPAFQLINHSSTLENEELVAVVMGVNMIIKRNEAAASSAAH